MGFLQPTLPGYDTKNFLARPYLERVKLGCLFAAEFGWGLPKVVILIYIAKLAALYVVGGVVVATLTSGLNPLDLASWWPEFIVYQKLVLWTVLLEVTGLGGAWGPLSLHFTPRVGGYLYFARRRTIRQPPWPDHVPLTRGDERTAVDVGLYLVLIVSLVVALVLPGEGTGDLPVEHGLVRPWSVVPAVVLLVLLGLRDKVAFLAARGEQYLPALIFFSFFPPVDMVVAAKLLIVLVWVAAGVSKLTKNFAFVIPPMMCNAPWMPRRIKPIFFRSYPEDLRPSRPAAMIAHVLGTFVEIITPLVLLLSTNKWVTLAAVVLMIGFHLTIIATFPAANPLEWNALFMYITAFLFLTFPAGDGFGVLNMNPWLLVLCVVGLTFFPILGNLRPDLVSFLPAMRQYAGNWCTSIWAFAPGAEHKIDDHVVKPALTIRRQLVAAGLGDNADFTAGISTCFRSLHAHGRAHNSLLLCTLGPDIDTYGMFDGDQMAGVLLGWNFGDGHLYGPRLIEAVQRRCHFEPGELIITYIESQPIHRQSQEYLVIDAAVGVIERGRVRIDDLISEQPWIPNGPVPFQATWRRPRYKRVRHLAG
ncbi:DUF3556 domain-containing protein [Mycobacterium sp. smrl_JER01]|uniref:DUF3556 domain-containing protein n=1 Tax=Mycobacterium sp. smrl_JER01 TaxID=3402633 RepID=UPI003ACE1139